MKLFPEEYGAALKGKSVCVGIQGDKFVKERGGDILNDLKYLLRFGVRLSVAHTFADKTEAEELFRRHAEVTSLYGQDFLSRILELAEEKRFQKIVLLETQGLRNKDGGLIDLISLSDLSKLNQLLAKASDEVRVRQILRAIQQSKMLKQVHIINGQQPWAIREELFSIEGIGTMLAEHINANFAVCDENDIHTILNLLKPQARSGNLLPRNYDYLLEHIDNFFKVTTDGILAGCVEKKRLSEEIVELGALVSAERFLGRRIGKFLLEGVMEDVKCEGFEQALVVTKNARLGKSLIDFYQFREIKPIDKNLSPEMQERMERSSYAQFFVKDL